MQFWSLGVEQDVLERFLDTFHTIARHGRLHCKLLRGWGLGFRGLGLGGLGFRVPFKGWGVRFRVDARAILGTSGLANAFGAYFSAPYVNGTTAWERILLKTYKSYRIRSLGGTIGGIQAFRPAWDFPPPYLLPGLRILGLGPEYSHMIVSSYEGVGVTQLLVLHDELS